MLLEMKEEFWVHTTQLISWPGRCVKKWWDWGRKSFWLPSFPHVCHPE